MKTPIIAFATLVSGCSFYTHPGSPVPTYPDPQTGYATHACSTSRAAPIADTLLTGVGAGLTGLAVYNAENTNIPTTHNPAQDQQNANIANAENWSLIGGAALMTAIYAGSAWYGYSKVARCEGDMERSENQANRLRVQYARNVKRQQEIAAQQEAARQATTASQIAAALARVQAIHDACVKSLPDRLLADKELKHHTSVQVYVDAACKVLSITKQQCSATGAFGATICSNVVVGSKLQCMGERPTKLDGSVLSDTDILTKNYTTNHDDVPSWERIVLSGKGCEHVDTEINRSLP